MSLHFARKSQPKAKYFVLEDTLLGQFSRKSCGKNIHLVKLVKVHPILSFIRKKKKLMFSLFAHCCSGTPELFGKHGVGKIRPSRTVLYSQPHLSPRPLSTPILKENEITMKHAVGDKSR